MMAAIMKEEFGAALISEAVESRPTLPSPEELKYKILFKVSRRLNSSLGRSLGLASTDDFLDKASTR